MNNAQWKRLFEVCADVLGEGSAPAYRSPSWCGWTTFSKIRSGGHYWFAGLPAKIDLGDKYILDGGVWGQPFHYHDLAHLLIPATFDWERGLEYGSKTQDLDALAIALTSEKLPHKRHELLLEVVCY